MSTNTILNTSKEEGNELKRNETLTEDIQRNKGSDTPQSNLSESDDSNSTHTNNQIAVQSFERFRKSSIVSIAPDKETISAPVNSPPAGDSIAEYCAESLYSYSFTPLSRVNKAAKIRRQILSRGVDYMRHLRYKARDRDMRRFSQPEIGILDQTNSWEDDTRLQPVNITTAGHPLSDSNLRPPIITTEHVSPGNQLASPTFSATAATNERYGLLSPDEEDFNLSRRQTIEVFNDLPPIYEAPQHTKELPYSAQYTRALHGPSRFLPQNQAILTTDADAAILLFNDMASLCFGIDKSYIGKSILDELEEPFRSQLDRMLKRRRRQSDVSFEDSSENGLVLVCGIVVPIRKLNGESMSAASLWLKEKKTDDGKAVYIWIFEEIYETSLSTCLDEKGNVVKVIGAAKELFGYEPNQIIGKPITQLIPTLSITGGSIQGKIDKIKFYGGKSSRNVFFPTMVTFAAPNMIKIISLPSIAGLITVHHTGIIQSINPVPSKYLFGYSPESLIEKVNINQLIPQFSQIVLGLHKVNFLQYSTIVNNHACRWAISDMSNENPYRSMEVNESLRSLERQPSISGNGKQRLPILHAVHRDGSQFEIQIQLRLIESEDEDLISIWVTYDRIYAQKRAKRRNHQPVAPPTKEKEEPPKRPPIRTYGISSFGSVDQKKALFPGGTDSPEEGGTKETVKVEKNSPMDDYVIIGTLGEGTYGTAKLAYRKDDITKTKVVIKCIAKSRIVVDSWIRDRQLGMIPLEIHILKKLKETPQENCCALESYMEDEDMYYAVMKLYGESSMDLFDYIELNEKMPEDEVRNIFKQIALAVEHIQRLHIVHRDIKDENILLDDTGCVHLIDFGSAAYFREGRTFDTFSGTLDYCAPEIFKGIPYEGPAQDIWSLGTLLYTLIYRENPFYNVDEIMEHDLRIPFVMSEASLDLIRNMLNRDVDKRYNIHQVLEHPWLNS